MNLKNFRMFLPIVAIATVCQSNQKKMEDKKFMSGEKAGVAGMQSAHVEKSNKSNVNDMIQDWPSRPKVAVQAMLVKYGQPNEISANRAIWMNAGPYKIIEVTRMEVPHDFPKPHMDFLRHTVSYNVPINKIDELTEFDASMSFDKTAGEMSAKCDLEGHNVLTLNLARDIIVGKKSVQEARKSFATNVADDQMGKKPAYVEKLQFEPQPNAAFLDVPNIPGSPIREAASSVNAYGTDAEVLSFVIAADDNEIMAAATAQMKNIRSEVKDYAKMLQTAHGKNQAAVMKLGQSLQTKPVDTKAVDCVRSCVSHFKTEQRTPIAPLN